MRRSVLPPGPSPTSFLSNFFKFRNNSLDFLKHLKVLYGDIVLFRIGTMNVLSLSHPDYIREILSVQNDNFIKGRPLEIAKELLGEGLLTSEGRFHKEHSRILQPAFHRKMMQFYAPVMIEYASQITRSWENNGEVDMLNEMIKMSTAIAGKTLFNVSIEKEVPQIMDALDSIMKLFGRISLPFSEWLLRIPLPGTIRFYKAKGILDRNIYRIIDQRRDNKYHGLKLFLMSVGWRYR